MYRQAVVDQPLEERHQALTRLGRYPRGIVAQGREQITNRVPSVQELPQIDAGRIQAETATAVGIEEHSPVIEFLTEHDMRIAYGSVTIVHSATLPFAQVATGMPGGGKALSRLAHRAQAWCSRALKRLYGLQSSRVRVRTHAKSAPGSPGSLVDNTGVAGLV